MMKLGENTESWSVRQAEECYGIKRWGDVYFSVNGAGHVQVHVDEAHPLDLKQLVDELAADGLHPPLLLRFSDILRQRMTQIHKRFSIARDEAGYTGRYYGVYPIKVNQQRQVVEEIVEFGSDLNWGLEAGSKPELHATLAMLEDVEGLIVCNGYKDREFAELALMGRKMGKKVFIVVEKPNELGLILNAAARLDVEPLIGLRCRLAATSNGRWEDSGGDKSKFGLSPDEILDAVEKLKTEGRLDCLRLLHFHIGSQVPQIRNIKQAMQEAARFYVEMHRLGAPIEYMDVGGGLGVNYDGSISGNSPASVDYSLQEYANDIVWTMKSICDDEELQQPHIISESGRALVAHHAVLIIDVLGIGRRTGEVSSGVPEDDAPLPLRRLWDTLDSLASISPREALHDAIDLRGDINKLFTLGHASLKHRALADDLFWRIALEVMPLLDEEECAQLSPDLESQMADRYFCNFSLFQSLPDAWAIDQVFPVMPIHRLDEQPERKGILVDITCDSDGKLAHFPLQDGISQTLPLHTVEPGDTYLIGIFLVGAYQEILGDLHNLFGDTHAVHVRMDGDHYELEQVVEGESVADVLEYVQFNEKVLVDRMRRQVQAAKAEGRISASEATAYLRFYQSGLHGYTYLEEDSPSLTPLVRRKANAG